MDSKKKSTKDYYAGDLVVFGISCLVFALFFLAPTLFTSEKSLIEKRGKVEKVKAFYTRVGSKGHKSVKSELILNLENDTRNYKLAKNIEQRWNNEKYELIEKELKKSGKAIVWIKKSEQSDMEPEVFKIATGENEVLYDMDDVKSELKFLFPFLIVLSIFAIGFYLNNKYPKRIKSLIK